jgi:starch synthase
MIAMRYGAIPIVRETGGLADTVRPYDINTGEGNGYGFKNINAHDMLYTIERAVDIYNTRRDIHNKLVAAAMAGDYSWNRSARRYKELYEYM